MSEPENRGGTAIEELQNQLQTLRALLAVALVVLIGFTFCADYLVSKQTQALKQETAQLESVYDRFPHAAANDFLKRMRDYAKTHPDFSPVAAKYPGVFGQPAAAFKK